MADAANGTVLESNEKEEDSEGVKVGGSPFANTYEYTIRYILRVYKDPCCKFRK